MNRTVRRQESRRLLAEWMPVEGAVRVILGRYGNAESPIAAPPTMNYLVVELKAGARWTYRPPVGHMVCWVAVQDGTLRTSAPVATGELAVFESSNDSIERVVPVRGRSPRSSPARFRGQRSVRELEIFSPAPLSAAR